MTRVTFPKLVFFDLDGTLIEPMDFERIKFVLGVESPVLENILHDSAKMEILKRFEIEHAMKANLMPHTITVLKKFEDLGIVRALITRNCLESVKIVCRRFGLKFDEVITREMGHFKPSPYHVIRLIEKYGFRKEDCLIVGDHEFDVLTGKKAGIRTAIVRKNSMNADFILRSLKDLLDIVEYDGKA
ncbi:HAD family hydrolase [Archaeoglobus profundus]|uniref:HAD-superfamily hydrolase, subfamily IA, variant 3 n=1 Tax=Archaeoglobus profundus (strain DSM 5631 / JCM 9629 / NBRC 100127 / Av18) TaxID=572546 RepID=D2RDV8_ARCPA|nr:HAD-IA family hydrolase [Archaeoglobus profundus]ADB58302.1 HAD-superfamily hydrolase, subfamily IA, variant 3 [Archaeoglobus profundus DSM 5631]